MVKCLGLWVGLLEVNHLQPSSTWRMVACVDSPCLGVPAGELNESSSIVRRGSVRRIFIDFDVCWSNTQAELEYYEELH